MTYITATNVRDASGVPTSLITDTQLTAFISNVESEMARWMNTAFVPTLKIDVLDGTGLNYFFTGKNPLLAVRELNTNDTDISVSSLNVYKESGKVELGISSETSTFISKSRDIKVKYLFGMLEESSTSTTSSAATTAGSSVAISVLDETGFSEDDWVEVIGMDGNVEVAQVESTASDTITVNKLVFSHESGSTVVLLQIPIFIKRYMEIEAAICCAINAIGATYTFNASYNLGELSVVKGVPYVHWEASTRKLIIERDMRQSRIRPRTCIMI